MAAAHHVQAALAGPGVIAGDRERVDRRDILTGRDVQGGLMGWDREDQLDLADIGREAAAATHGDTLPRALLAGATRA
jgi:hypothetical protein